ncbi:MAG: hypothetical protein FWE28_05775 [Oscillospiraceae bacterium]|nr:hypothetical protein [Oscillospiraceae bacterium]
MKKKIGLVLVALLLVLTLAACSAEEGTPEDRAFAAYMTWLERIGSAGEPRIGAWDSDFVMDVDMRFFGMTFHTVATGTSQAIVDGDHVTMYMEMDMDMGMPGVPAMNMEMFMEMEGFTLIDTVMLIDGQYISGLADEMDDALSPLETMESMNQVPEFMLDDIVEVELYEGEDYTVFTIIVDGDAVGEFMNQNLEQAYAVLDEFGMDFDFGAEDLTLILTVDEEGEPLAVTMDMIMEMVFDEDFEEEELAGQSFSVSYSITYTYHAFGDDVVVMRPEVPEQPEVLEQPDVAEQPDAAEELDILLDIDFDNLHQPEVFVGTWAWDADDSYIYVFYADGIGFRGFDGEMEEFDWTVEGDDHLLILSLDTYQIESWSFVIADGVLTIDNRQVAGMTWSYVFQG